MKKLDLKEIHEVTLNVMDRIHAICEENDIRYTLMFGTLIGAFRHQGFIPWDDDLDICMLREDYDRFCEITGKEKGRYRLVDRANTENYLYGIARYCDSHYEYRRDLAENRYDLGVFVDIYPMDSCGETAEETAPVYQKVLRRNQEYFYYCTKYSMTGRWKNLIKVPYYSYLHMKYGPDYPQKIDKSITDTIYSHFQRDSKYVGVYWEPPEAFMLFEREPFLNRELHVFEDRQYWIPTRATEILTQYYGDYMKLPPESERVTTHSYSIYEKEDFT